MNKDQFKQHRIALGYTQSALAAELGFTLSAVQKWEGGANKIPLSVKKAMYRLLEQEENRKEGV